MQDGLMLENTLQIVNPFSRALLLGLETRDDYSVIRAEVPLAEMFGYSTELRSLSQGMATFSMEFAEYRPLSEHLLSEIR